MTTLATLSCAMIGMIFGIYAKNQMNANSVVTPAVLILMLIPMFADLMPIMAILSNYLFTGVVIESINSLTYNSIIVTPMQWTVLLIECVLSIIAFLFLYKKNGFEA
jgi:ABC-2 type transport system permease protein